MSTTTHTAIVCSTTRIYQIDGMTCGHCVSAVTSEVGALDAVTDVHVELTTGDVTVTSTRPLTDSEIAAAVNEAGYALRG
ncbi:heavy-metal-associated domain-containing protein [uncultured Nocardioides sp.]|uniref:heavy-metal-associated domain-containing protein n=1 Tax=uncultured Nocardioides sp. TaxID=198441 RepID=UPI00262E9818|nr:heavy-metal-associated domain-containing protein [uncultured Nocardioides sp.]